MSKTFCDLSLNLGFLYYLLMTLVSGIKGPASSSLSSKKQKDGPTEHQLIRVRLKQRLLSSAQACSVWCRIWMADGGWRMARGGWLMAEN